MCKLGRNYLTLSGVRLLALEVCDPLFWAAPITPGQTLQSVVASAKLFGGVDDLAW
jgi:hypothetical protein